jgi:cytochrome c-type biogenesis protein CcmH
MMIDAPEPPPLPETSPGPDAEGSRSGTTRDPVAIMSAGSSPGGTSRIGRLALAGAAVIAVIAGGIAIYRSQATQIAAPSPSAAASQQPTVDSVIAKLEAKLKTDPNDAEGWRMLGWSYFQTERFAEAATALQHATKLDGKTAETFSFLGESLVLASKEEGHIPSDAQAAFDQALKLDPKDARARYFKGVAIDMAGEHRRAIDLWFDLLKDTPADAPYADDVRGVIRKVGEKNKIDVEKRRAEARFAPAAGGMITNGAAKAAGGIPGPDQAQMQAAAKLPPGQQDAMVRGMVDGLEAKLKTNPANANGWIMLMRSRMQLGEPAKAGQALQAGLAAFKNDSASARQIREAATTLGIAGA